MSNDLQPIEAIEISTEAKSIKITEFGIEFPLAPSIKEWAETVIQVTKGYDMMQFYLGDLMVYAESPVTGWGESKYKELIAATDLDYQTLARFAQIARRFPVDFREQTLRSTERNVFGERLSWSHFKEVVSLEDDQALHFLNTAREKRWSKDKLREEVQKFVGRPEKVEPPVGFTSFRDIGKKIFKGYVPQKDNVEYDEKAWLIEIKEWAEEKLRNEYGVGV